MLRVQNEIECHRLELKKSEVIKTVLECTTKLNHTRVECFIRVVESSGLSYYWLFGFLLILAAMISTCIKQLNQDLLGNSLESKAAFFNQAVLRFINFVGLNISSQITLAGGACQTSFQE